MESLAYQLSNKVYPDGYHEEVRTELLNGIIVAMSPRPFLKHNKVAGNIHNIFRNYLKKRPCEVYFEVDVHLTKNDKVVPDIVVVCNKDIIKANAIYGAPDLVVEVLSRSTRARDKGYKLNLYEKSGVREYWIVDAQNLSIDVYLPENESGRLMLTYTYDIFYDYELENMTDEEKAAIPHEFKTSLFDDLIIKLGDVFDGIE